MADSRIRTTLTARLGAKSISPPDTMARMPFNQLTAAGWVCAGPGVPLLQRQASRQGSGGFPVTRTGQEIPPNAEFQRLIVSIRTNERCRRYRPPRRLRRGEVSDATTIGLRPLANSRKAAALFSIGIGRPRPASFVAHEARRNTANVAAAPPLPAASGVRYYTNFRNMAGCPPFPTLTDTVLSWGAMSSPGRNSARYLERLTRACVALRRPTGRSALSAMSVSRGSADAEDMFLKFQNYISPGVFPNPIKRIRMNDEVSRPDPAPIWRIRARRRGIF